VKLRLNREEVWADRIAWMLYRMALGDEIADSNLREISRWAWDALDLADSGYVEESRDEIVRQMSGRAHGGDRRRLEMVVRGSR